MMPTNEEVSNKVYLKFDKDTEYSDYTRYRLHIEGALLTKLKYQILDDHSYYEFGSFYSRNEIFTLHLIILTMKPSLISNSSSIARSNPKSRKYVARALIISINAKLHKVSFVQVNSS